MLILIVKYFKILWKQKDKKIKENKNKKREIIEKELKYFIKNHKKATNLG